MFILLTEEYKIAKDLLNEIFKKAKNDLLNLNEKQIESENELKRIEFLIKYLEEI